jgi:hypothetical protein
MIWSQTKNLKLGKFWRVLQWKIMYRYMYILWTLGPFTVFCYNLWTFSIVRGNLVYFSPFWYFVAKKIWQPWVAGAETLVRSRPAFENVSSAYRFQI